MSLFHFDPKLFQIMLSCVARLPIGTNQEAGSYLPGVAVHIMIPTIRPLLILCDFKNRSVGL